MNQLLLRPKQVCHKLGISPATLWRWVNKNPSFPKPFKIGANSTAFDSAELATWVQDRKNGRVG